MSYRGYNCRDKSCISKMRLVPIGKGKSKKLTIPHLELLAVLIGVRAANIVVSELRLNICEKILWIDSQCVLHWLKTKKPLSVFWIITSSRLSSTKI